MDEKVTTRQALDRGLLFGSEADTVSLAPPSSSKFSENVNETVSLSQAIDISTAIVLEQPVFQHLDGVPNLQRHQQESKTTAATWRTEVRSLVFKVNDAILNYGTQFNAFYADLRRFAETMGDDPEAGTNLIIGLHELKKEIAKQKKTTEEVGRKLEEFYGKMTNHKSDLSADAIEIEAKYTGDKGELHDLKTALETYDAAMRRDLAMIAGGSIGIVLGVVSAVIGVALWVGTGGLATPVIIAGIGSVAGIVGGSVAIGIGADSYNTNSQHKSAALNRMSKLSSEITVANNLRNDVASLLEHIGVIAENTKALANAWSQLERDYDNVIEALDSTDPESAGWIVKNHLDAAKTKWDELYEDARTLKTSFLTPPKIETDALMHAVHGVLSIPEVVIKARVHPAKMHAVPSGRMAIVPQQTPALKNTQLELWVDEMSRSLLNFEHSLDAAMKISNAPADVIASKKNLVSSGDVAAKSAKSFLADLESLSAFSHVLLTTAQLPDAEIVIAGLDVFRQLATKLTASKQKGSTSVSDFNQLSQAQMTTTAGINGWLNGLQSDKVSEQMRIDDMKKLLDQYEREKEQSKNDFWWCLLSTIACIVAAIERQQKIDSANAKIKALSDQLKDTEKSLKNVIDTYTAVSTLGSTISNMSHDIDGILRALQILLVSVEGINASHESTTPFIIRNHLKAVAEQLTGIAGTRMRSTGRLMKLMVVIAQADKSGARLIIRCHRVEVRTRDQEEPTANDNIQQLTYFTMNIESAAKLITSQPKLVYVENLLRENQQLVAGHSLDWQMIYSNKVVSVLSRINGIGGTLKFMGPSIHDRIVNDEIADAILGLESIETDLDRFGRFLYEAKVLTHMFLLLTKDDKYRFITVGDVLREQLEGDKGELKALESQEAALSAELTATLEYIVNASTQLLVRDLGLGLVIGISLALGQVQFAAVGGTVMMNVIKDKANMVIKKVSSTGASQAANALANIDQRQNNVLDIVEERGQALSDISKLSVDIATLHILVQSVNDFDRNADQLLLSLDAVAGFIEDEISNFYTIKLLLKYGGKEVALKRFDEAMENWKSITDGSTLLLETYYSSF